jgi:glyoxylase-like metal-dependent hydrolase (beta-lactamase superfamily II)
VPYLNSIQVDIAAIPIPLPHIGSVNVWLLRGDPLTLIDTGPANEQALAALERGLRAHGVRLEDVEQVLATHHHLDHVGLAAALQQRSGAVVAVPERVAEYGARYAQHVVAERAFSHELMATHGVPTGVIDDNEDFWEFIHRNSADFRADIPLRDGDRVRAGDRTLRVVERPGHSASDALLVDEDDRLAFVGDHLLAGISSNTEIYPLAGTDDARPPTRLVYLENLRRTARMPLRRLLTGHGPEVTGHARLVRRREAEHRRRCAHIVEALGNGASTAYELAGDLWSARTVARQPLLVVWEVLGHLDLLAAGGAVTERLDDHGRARFALSDQAVRAVA